MKKITYLIFLGLIVAFAFDECGEDDRQVALKSVKSPKTIRIAFEGNGTSVECSLNAGNRVVWNSAGCIERLRDLKMRHGDVIVMESPPDKVATRQVIDWLIKENSRNRVAMYILPKPKSTEGIFGIPIYHWTAPFNDPRDFGSAAFYFEGHLLGEREIGFTQMLKHIERRKPKQLFILGNRHETNEGFSPWECPYAERISELDGVLTSTKSEVVHPADANY